MTRFQKQRQWAVSWASACLALAGCHAGRVDLVRSGALALQRDPGGRGYFRDIFVDGRDDGIVVTGFVRRLLPHSHVHAEALWPDENPLGEARADVYRPLASPRVRHARLEALVKIPANAIATIRIKHHLRGY